MRGLEQGETQPDAARHHRQRQDVHGRQRHPALQTADADHRAEQDARGAALRRDAGALPGQRGRVLRQLLRLLPARGVHPDDRHVHREGRDHQRPDRSHAPRGDARAPLARRRDHRRQRQLHLRHRLGRELPRPADRDRQGRGAPARRAPAAAGRHPVRAQRHRLSPRHVPRARRRGRDLPGLRGERRRSASSSSATRSRASARSIRCAAGCSGSSSATRSTPARTTSRRAAAARNARSTAIRDELRERLDVLRQGRAASSRSSASSSARCTTSRCSSRWASAGHRELLAPPLGPQRRASRRRRCIDYFPEGLPAGHRRVAPDRAADRRDVPRRSLAQGDAGRVRLPPAERARQPPAQVRGVREAHATHDLFVSATPGDYELAARRRASSSSRSSARPG